MKQVEPFISIVTVSLNAAATIEDTIASISLQQANFIIEHICVDGGSTDDTRKIIDRWASRSNHISRIYESDRGIFDAMNKGLSAAKGEYVLFLNADDFLVSSNAISTAMDGLFPGSPDNPDLVVGDVSMGVVGRRGLWRHRRVPRLLGRLRGFGLFPIHQGQLTKRRLLQRTGGFDSRLRLASDVNLYYDMERNFHPSIRRVHSDIAFMSAGGAANSGLKAMYIGTVEIYKHLSRSHSFAKAAGMVFVKSLQSFSELRYGRCPCERWFISADPDSPPAMSSG